MKIASLETIVQKPEGIINRLKSLFKPYEISAKTKKQNKISVLSLRYISHRGSIDWNKVYSYLVGCSKTVLCKPDLLPDNTPIIRFDDKTLVCKLMFNFIGHLLDQASFSLKDIRIGLIDPDGSFTEMTSVLIRYTSNLYVLTDMPKFYENVSDHLLKEYGMSFMIHNESDLLKDCDIVIAPKKLSSSISVPAHSVLFTTQSPQIPLRCCTITDYIVDVPYKYQRIQPDHTDNCYFLSALYSLCGVKELENIIPVKCTDGNGLFTAERLIHHLNGIKKTA